MHSLGITLELSFVTIQLEQFPHESDTVMTETLWD